MSECPFSRVASHITLDSNILILVQQPNDSLQCRKPNNSKFLRPGSTYVNCVVGPESIQFAYAFNTLFTKHGTNTYDVKSTKTTHLWGGTEKGIFNTTRRHFFLALSKLKAFADAIFIVIHFIKFSFYWVENIVRKWENAGYLHCLLFQRCFQKPFCRGRQK